MLKKDPDWRVQEAITLAVDEVAELGGVRQASFWCLEQILVFENRLYPARIQLSRSSSQVDQN